MIALYFPILISSMGNFSEAHSASGSLNQPLLKQRVIYHLKWICTISDLFLLYLLRGLIFLSQSRTIANKLIHLFSIPFHSFRKLDHFPSSSSRLKKTRHTFPSILHPCLLQTTRGSTAEIYSVINQIRSNVTFTGEDRIGQKFTANLFWICRRPEL